MPETGKGHIDPEGQTKTWVGGRHSEWEGKTSQRVRGGRTLRRENKGPEGVSDRSHEREGDP